MRAAKRALLVTLTPSAALAAFSLLMHLLAGVCVAVSALPPPACLALLAVVACSLCHERLARAAPGRSRSIVAVGVDARDEWRLVRCDGSIARVRLDAGACVHPLLVVATFSTDRGTRERVVIVPGMAAKDDLRALRVVMRTAPRLD